jgi:Fe-S cluster biogenesis protein NfuA
MEGNRRASSSPPGMRGLDVSSDVSNVVSSEQNSEDGSNLSDETVGTEGTAGGPDITDDERADRLSQLNSIIELMRPAVQADGGDLALVHADAATGVVEVQLQGACSSCAVSASTLQGGVERILHDRLPWVVEVRGGVDESVDPFESEALGRGGYVPSF